MKLTLMLSWMRWWYFVVNFPLTNLYSSHSPLPHGRVLLYETPFPVEIQFQLDVCHCFRFLSLWQPLPFSEGRLYMWFFSGGLGENPGTYAIVGWISCSLRQRFFFGHPSFPQILIRSGMVDKQPRSGFVSSKSIFIYWHVQKVGLRSSYWIKIPPQSSL